MGKTGNRPYRTPEADLYACLVSGGETVAAPKRRGSFTAAGLDLLAATLGFLALTPRASAGVETLTMRSQKIVVGGFEVRKSLIRVPKPGSRKGSA